MAEKPIQNLRAGSGAEPSPQPSSAPARASAHRGDRATPPALVPRQRIHVLRGVALRRRAAVLGLGGAGRGLRGGPRVSVARGRGGLAPASEEADQGEPGETGSGHASSRWRAPIIYR